MWEIMPFQKEKKEQFKMAWIKCSGINLLAFIVLNFLLSLYSHQQALRFQCALPRDFFVFGWYFPGQSLSTVSVVLYGKIQIRQVVILLRLINYLVNVVPFALKTLSCAQADLLEKVFLRLSLPLYFSL